METITATYAARHVLPLLRRVEQGESFIITFRGKVVARLVPIPDQKPDHVPDPSVAVGS